MTKELTVYIGWDPRETDAYHVAARSIRELSTGKVLIYPIVKQHAEAMGFYWRPTERRDGRLFDVISDKPMSTEFAITRFLVPFYEPPTQWALFVDADVMAMSNVEQVLEEADPSFAVQCVKHEHWVVDGSRKMDGQLQMAYPRKNWSSVVLWNADHPANKRLTLEDVNTKPGLWLHQFKWLHDNAIGELSPAWNYLVSESDQSIDPKICHFTLGIPSMPGYEKCEYADIWRAWRAKP